MTQSLIEFNPDPRIERVPIVDGQWCYVIDDALLDPERLVRFAAEQRSEFHMVDYNAYPGLLLPTPGEISEKLNAFFIDHLRRLFDARRVLHMHSRLAMVTLPPEQLRPYQRICHSDTMSPDPQHSLQASVLYLFRDESLGGTSFYRSEIAAGASAFQRSRRICRMRNSCAATTSSPDICANRIAISNASPAFRRNGTG